MESKYGFKKCFDEVGPNFKSINRIEVGLDIRPELQYMNRANSQVLLNWILSRSLGKTLN